MKLHEILTEDQELQEGPLLNKIGTGIGNVVGGVAKAAGAVAGGIAGLGAAAKKGFQAGKQTVAGAGDEPAAGGSTAPAATGGAAPAATSSGGAQTQTLANPKDPNTGKSAAAGAGGAQPETPAGGPPKSNTPFGRLAQAAAGQDPNAAEPAKTAPAAGADAQAQTPAAGGGSQTGTAAAPAADGNAARPTSSTFKGTASVSVPNKDPAPAEQPAANDAEFQKVQQNIGKLPPEQQKELMAALMADPEVKKALEQPAAADAEQKPAATPAAQPETPAAAQAQTSAVKPARQRDATGRFIGKNAPRAEPTAVNQAQIDADRNRLIQQQESKIKKSTALSESSISHVDKMIAVNRGLQRGLANPFAGPGNDSEETPTNTSSNTIVDRSGTVPVKLIQQVNALESAERQQLFKFLKAKQ